MNNKTALAVLLAAVVSLSVVVPASSASNIHVTLNPAGNEASVDAYVNSTFVLSLNSTSPLAIAAIQNALPASGNVSANYTARQGSSQAFDIFNSSISANDSNAYLKSLGISYSSEMANHTTSSSIAVYVNSSIGIQMTVGNIFQNNTANLSWRGFNIGQGISLNGTSINKVNTGGVNLFSSPPGHIINMSVFAKSLLQWNRTYDSATNTTTFSMDAGNIIDFSSNGSYQGFNITLSFTLDPSYSISSPGYDTAGTNTISIGNQPSRNPVVYYAIAGVMFAGIVLLSYVRKGRSR